ncbi:MAG: hypothetical protein GAK41_01492 [Burkholderia gladioli]|nr:MAG: hypothetical protein GAK41_01492 [Burkholderia gladioli]
MRANLLRTASWNAAATRVDIVNNGTQPAWWIASQSGYDRAASAKAIKNWLEIVREYTDKDGKPLGKIALGDEIGVHLKIRATGSASVGNIAIVDLLPGGFDPVLTPPRHPPPTRRTAAATATAMAARPPTPPGARRSAWKVRPGSRSTPTSATTAW